MPTASKAKNDDADNKAASIKAQTPQRSAMSVVSSQWPYLVAALTGVGWTAHQAWRDKRPHRAGKWDYYASMDDVKKELDDDGEKYMTLMRECVSGVVCMIPRVVFGARALTIIP